jgi:hypothetical protein
MSETPETGMKLDVEYLKRQKEAKNYIAQIEDHQDRFVYKGNYYDVENCINAERQRDEAVALLKGMVGLVQLMASRKDMPAAPFAAMHSNHRYADALQFLATLDRTEKP